MSNSNPLPLRTPGSYTVKGFGECRTHENGGGWHQRRALKNGGEFVLLADGDDCPTASQLTFWNEIDAQLPNLLSIARESVTAPPAYCFSETKEIRNAEFNQEDLELYEIMILDDITFLFRLESDSCKEIMLIPEIQFSRDGNVLSVEWLW